MFENFSFSNTCSAVRPLDSPVYSPKDIPPWSPPHLSTFPPEPVSLSATLDALSLRATTRAPTCTPPTTGTPLHAFPGSGAGTHAQPQRRMQSASGARGIKSDVRLQRQFLMQLQALAGAGVVEISRGGKKGMGMGLGGVKAEDGEERRRKSCAEVVGKGKVKKGSSVKGRREMRRGSGRE